MTIINKALLKKILFRMTMRYNYYSRTYAFKRRYKTIDAKLFNNTLEQSVINTYKKKWGVFSVKVEIDTFVLCYNLSGKIDYNIVPENIFAAIIEPTLNKYRKKHLTFLSVKNIYEKWFDNKDLFPKSYFHKMDNIYYDNQLNIIGNIDEFLNKQTFSYPLICKPSIGTAGGLGVKILNNLEEVKQTLDTYDNLVYQEKILQNSEIDKINPGMSSIRACLYRDSTGKFEVLNDSMRFGVDGSLDNETAGGLVCNINNDGTLNSYGINKYCVKHTEHPNSKVVFADVVVPLYDKLAEVTKALSNEIPLCNLVSLDMCLDINNNWRCIEINLGIQTIRFAQYAGLGFFADYTDEVIQRVLQDIAK